MKISRLLLILVMLLIHLFDGSRIVTAAPQSDWSIPNGHFFTQAAKAQGGFSVIDDEAARFWSEFQRLGGLQNVGYPISRRFVYDGFVTQAFQKLVLQWRPEVGEAWPVNVFDEFHRKDFDNTLLAQRQTPRHVPGSQFDRAGASWSEIVAGRQALLNANPAIRARYFSVADPLNVFGLPTTRVEDMGNHYALRTQRAVFQQWKENVPWASQGQVTIANGGDIAKELGWLAGPALQPEGAPPAAGGTSTIPANWKTYQGEYVTFAYPPAWQPTARQPFAGAILEDIQLGIPGLAADQSIGFSEVPLNQIKPDDVAAEETITLGGKEGVKWTRVGAGFVTYDYCTIGYNDEGSFCIHVTVPAADQSLEQQLDTLAQSLLFR